VNTSDADVGRNSEVTYALADLDPDIQRQGRRSNRPRATKQREADDDNVGHCVERFHIDALVGIVTAKTPLDYEQQAVYRCRVLAVDGGDPPNTGNLTYFDIFQLCKFLPYLSDA